MSPLLELEAVSRRYTRPRRQLFRPAPPLVAVDDVTLRLGVGETLGIVGESGSGKSTLARLAMAIEAPDAGRVRFDGEDLNGISTAQLRRLRPAFQMIFQDPFSALDPRRRIGWSIGQPLRAMGRHATGDAVAEALTHVGLRPADAARFPHEFSGGQRQRIAIARAIVTRPRLLVADEAVSALDVSVRAQILNLLMDLQESFGLAILFISHDLGVVASLCDHLIVLQQGKVIEEGNAAEILARPRHDATRTLLAAAELQTPTRTPESRAP